MSLLQPAYRRSILTVSVGLIIVAVADVVMVVTRAKLKAFALMAVGGFGILKGIITGLFNNFEQHRLSQNFDFGCVLGNEECGMKGLVASQ